MLAAAGMLWLASNMQWLTVSADDDKAGPQSVAVKGSTYSTEILAVALLVVAAAVALLVLRRWGRRFVAGIAGLAAIGASLSPVSILTTDPDYSRLHALLSTRTSARKATDAPALESWAQITGVEVHHLGPVLALLACALVVMAAVVVLMRPGADGVRANAYERKATRAEKLQEDLEESPDSGRVMWDALDEDIDPTDVK
ncbi:TIGR02234 family membrane protein [Corynebacterium tapiri]|uniref:TIGR02234 family membrane protein n=2 Tax=Corynebacterium tapiri TaxID=1448266 RepID=A0A5C4U5A5_9CORY|nr:TIGR02234 family membrane protein [Corynebacterium tapiri]